MTTTNDEILQSKILIVDDEPVNVLLLEHMLESEAYSQVFSTNDPRQVLPMQKDIGFDLILLDIRMPHMSGIDVLKELRAHLGTKFVPVLVLTAQPDDETRSNALGAGANDFLTKPFQTWEVLSRIRNSLISRQFYKGQVLRADTLEEQVKQRTQEIRATQLSIVLRLGRAGEYRDNETGTHVIRMSKSCNILALAAGFSESHAEAGHPY